MLLRKAELIHAQEDARDGKGRRGDELPKELQRRQDRLDALRKAKAELEAAADRARRREQQARFAEEQVVSAAAAATEDNSSKTDTGRVAAVQALANEAQQAERRAKIAGGRAELARGLAIDKPQSAGFSTPDPLNSADPLAMPSRNLPTTAAGDPNGNAQRNHRCAEGFAYLCHESNVLNEY